MVIVSRQKCPTVSPYKLQQPFPFFEQTWLLNDIVGNEYCYLDQANYRRGFLMSMGLDAIAQDKMETRDTRIGTLVFENGYECHWI